MKKNLGKLFILSIVFGTILQAHYTWTLKIDKTKLHENESAHVTLHCAFDEPASTTYVELTPLEKGVLFQQLSFSDRVTDEKREINYTFLVRILSSKVKHITLNPLMRVTTEESIKDTILGRDNAHELTFEDTQLHLKSKPLTILKNKHKTVGVFTLTQHVNKTTVKAFEPVQVQVTLEGIGNFDTIRPWDVNISGAKVFQAKVDKDLKLTSEGSKGKMVWHYAIVSDKNMTFPKIRLDYFNLNSKSIKIIQTKAIPITVQRVMPEQLVDKEDTHDTNSIDWLMVLGYIATFIAGVLSYYGASKIDFKTRQKKQPWYEVYETPLALLYALINTNEPKYQDVVAILEKDIQEKQTKSMKYYFKQIMKVR